MILTPTAPFKSPVAVPRVRLEQFEDVERLARNCKRNRSEGRYRDSYSTRRERCPQPEPA